MTNLDIIFKNRDITLPTKVSLVKVMIFPGAVYGYELDYKESWVSPSPRWRRSAALRRDPGEPSEDCFDGDHSFEDIGLAAGRSQREKKRSYKDFLREEEEIAAQVRNSSKKKLKVNSKHLN